MVTDCAAIDSAHSYAGKSSQASIGEASEGRNVRAWSLRQQHGLAFWPDAAKLHQVEDGSRKRTKR